jgi:hypothetical protein
MEPLPPKLERRRRDLERALGRPVHVRSMRTPEAELRGRLRVERDRVVIEYQIAEQGYFWHIPIIEELLSRAAAGHSTYELREPSPDPGEAPPGR